RVDVQSATARGQTSRGAVPPPTATAWISSSPLSSRYASSIPRDYRLAAMRAPQLPGTVHRKRRRVIQPLNYAPSRRKEPGCPWRTCTGHKRCRSALVLTFPSAAPTTGGKARRRSGIARDSCRRPAGPTRSVRSGSTCTRRRRALLQPKRPRAQARSFSYGNPSDSPGREVMNHGGTLGRQARGRQAAATHAVTGSAGRGGQAGTRGGGAVPPRVFGALGDEDYEGFALWQFVDGQLSRGSANTLEKVTSATWPEKSPMKRSRCALVCLTPSMTGHKLMPAVGLPLKRVHHQDWSARSVEAQRAARNIVPVGIRNSSPSRGARSRPVPRKSSVRRAGAVLAKHTVRSVYDDARNSDRAPPRHRHLCLGVGRRSQ